MAEFVLGYSAMELIVQIVRGQDGPIQGRWTAAARSGAQHFLPIDL